MAKIMLVDDAAFMRMMVKNALTKSGYDNFVEAQDGAEAVKKYDEEKPDMVIMDITMPNMDGLEALKEDQGSASGRKDCYVYCHGSGGNGG